MIALDCRFTEEWEMDMVYVLTHLIGKTSRTENKVCYLTPWDTVNMKDVKFLAGLEVLCASLHVNIWYQIG